MKFTAPRSRVSTVLTVAAATVTPVLYLLFLNRFAIDAFYSDDWSVVPMVHAALHDHLSLSQLWNQHNESRLFIGNIIDVVFGFADRLDLRSVIFFSALLFIVSYAGLLAIIRTYIGRRLTPIPVLVAGILWFSLADIQNELWAFQVSWYLTVMFFIMMLVVLLVPGGHRTLWFAAAVLIALAASLSTVQGFICWPVGVICILWNRTQSRRAFGETAAWIGALVLTLVLYLPGYRFGAGNTCLVRSACSTTYMLHHPVTALGFFFALIGNVIPGPPGLGSPVHDEARFVLIGVVLFVASLFIFGQSWRHRASTERLPVPLLLISFALLFDVTISLGRSGIGPAGAVNGNRFVMANLILLMGIAIYTWAHIPIRPLLAANGPGRVRLTYLAAIAVAVFLAAQVTVATGFGFTNGRLNEVALSTQARLLVDLRPIHTLNRARACQLFLGVYFFPPASTLRTAGVDELSEFRPSSVRHYQDLGPPPVPLGCRPHRT